MRVVLPLPEGPTKATWGGLVGSCAIKVTIRHRRRRRSGRKGHLLGAVRPRRVWAVPALAGGAGLDLVAVGEPHTAGRGVDRDVVDDCPLLAVGDGGGGDPVAELARPELRPAEEGHARGESHPFDD